MPNDPHDNESQPKLAQEMRLYDQAAKLARFGAWECDLATERLTWTDSVYDLFGFPVGSPLNRRAIVDLYTEESRREMEIMRAEAIATGRGVVFDAAIRIRQNETRWIRLSIGVAHVNGVATRIFGAKQDVTDEREAFDRLRVLAERDPLTGVANRRLFDAHYRQFAVERSGRDGASALALIDLDHFKQINDVYGHGAGDTCLRQVAARLQQLFCDEAVVVARVGGDEFAVLLRAPMSPARIRQRLRRAVDALSRPIVWDGRRLDVGASIGAAILAGPLSRKTRDLYAAADEALYIAKTAGRKRFHVFGDTAVGPAGSITADRSREVSGFGPSPPGLSS